MQEMELSGKANALGWTPESNKQKLSCLAFTFKSLSTKYAAVI